MNFSPETVQKWKDIGELQEKIYKLEKEKNDGKNN